jgi:hypothetical protein
MRRMQTQGGMEGKNGRPTSRTCCRLEVVCSGHRPPILTLDQAKFDELLADQRARAA